MKKLRIILTFFILLFFAKAGYGQVYIDNEEGKSLKSAYVINFIKLIQWSNEDAIKVFHVAIYEDTLGYRVFKNEFKNRSVREKEVEVSLVTSASDLSKFQVLVIPKSHKADLAAIYAKYQKNRLIISEDAGIKNSMIDFYISDNKLKFSLNEQGILNSGLKVDKYLLSLAITDVSRLQHMVAETEKMLRESQSAIDAQQLIIKKQQDEIKKQNSEIELKIQDLKNKEESLSNLNIQIKKLEQDIIKQTQLSMNLEQNIQLKESDLKEKINLLREMIAEKAIKEAQIKEDRKTLSQNRQEIQKAQKILNRLEIEVEKNKKLLNTKQKIIDNNRLKIEKQQYLIGFSIIIIAIAIVFAFFILRSNRINRLANKRLMKQNFEIEMQAKKLKEKSDMINEQNEELLQINEELYVAKKQTELSEHNLKEAQQIGNVGHWEYNLLTGEMHWSEQTYRIFEKEPGSFDLNMESILNFTHVEDRDKLQNSFQTSIANKTNFDLEHRIITSSGKIKYVIQKASIKSDKSGIPVYVLGTVSDITELKQIEIVIQQQNSELEELNRTKDKFFSIIAHDLKNPFNSIIGLSGILMKNSEKFDKEKVLDISIALNEAAKSGYGLLENLLEWSRSQSGRIEYHPSKLLLMDVLDSSIKQVDSFAKKKEIEIKMNQIEDVYIVGDLNMLNTIIRNLISNAIKYSNKKSTIELSAKKQNGHIRVSVKDFGVGIPEEIVSKLFRIEVKNSTPGTESETGTGLGLILCKEFVEKHGGKIWVESQEGKGSVFSFTLKRFEE